MTCLWVALGPWTHIMACWALSPVNFGGFEVCNHEWNIIPRSRILHCQWSMSNCGQQGNESSCYCCVCDFIFGANDELIIAIGNVWYSDLNPLVKHDLLSCCGRWYMLYLRCVYAVYAAFGWQRQKTYICPYTVHYTSTQYNTQYYTHLRLQISVYASPIWEWPRWVLPEF